ncbi:MAG: carbohydrate ABC transporter permease [Clostridia bacterium]|nr:carbohydrate ABC transporter permease [Clostridia bacterium]
MRKIYKLMPVYALLSLGAVFMVFPFVWMVLTSLKTGADVYSFSMIPNPATTQNYSFVFTRTDFVRWFLNSIFVAVMVVSSVLMFDTLVGYTLCKMQFRGKQLVFILIMSTLMVPTEMLIIPWYLMSAQLKWLNTYWSIMFPGLITAFGIFMMRQFFEGVPDELLEAARIDGLNELGIYARIALPLVMPAVSALAIFTFLGNWNAFLWPVIIVSNKELVTLPVGLAMFTTENNPEWERIMTAASLGTVPVLAVFMVFQRQIIEGINLSGLKA